MQVDTLIVGGGIAGLSTAWNLGQLGGERVLVLERESAFGTHASAQNASILKELGEDSLTSELERRSARFLRNPPAGFADGPLVEECGLYLIADASSEEAFDDVLSRADGVLHEILTASQVRERLGFYRRPVTRAAFFPRDGRVQVPRLLAAFAEGAREKGVHLQTNAEVSGLLREDGVVRGATLTDGTEIRAKTTVLASGAWAGALAEKVGSRLRFRPTRRHLLVSAPTATVDPGGSILWHIDGRFYVRPERGGWLACAGDQTDVDPDRLELDPAEPRRISSVAAEAVTGFPSGPPQDRWCGLRTFSSDGSFVIGADPDLPGLFWVAGLGGAGIGCGPELGRTAARLLLGRAVDEPWVRDLSPGRFLAATPRS